MRLVCLFADKWRQIFDKFDPEGFGEIPWSDFGTALYGELGSILINTGKRDILLEKCRTATTPAITFQEFINIVSTLI